MCLLIRSVISEKVANVQSTFDVGDFKHPDKVESKHIKDTSNQNKLIIGCERLYDKKTSSDEIYVDEKGVYHYVVPHCSHCKSTNVTKHDTNLTPVYSKDGENRSNPTEVFVPKNNGSKDSAPYIYTLLIMIN